MAVSIFAIHLLGDLWSPPLIGWVADNASMVVGMLIIPVAFFVGSLIWWGGKRVPGSTTVVVESP